MAGRGRAVGDWFGDTAYSGSLVLAVPVALIAGLVSFFSPCVVPLLPGYISYVTGLSGADLQHGHRGRMLAGTGLFVLGFSFVFVSLGTLMGAIGTWFLTNQRTLSIVLGLVVIVMGLAFLGAVPFLQRDVRIHRVPDVGVAAAPLLGVTFGLGWIPCLGPTLTAVLALSMDEASAGRGALLTLAYTLGLGVPFIVAALAFRRMLGATAWLRRHQAWFSRLGGLMLIAVGLMLLTGWWNALVTQMQVWVPGFTTVV